MSKALYFRALGKQTKSKDGGVTFSFTMTREYENGEVQQSVRLIKSMRSYLNIRRRERKAMLKGNWLTDMAGRKYKIIDVN